METMVDEQKEKIEDSLKLYQKLRHTHRKKINRIKYLELRTLSQWKLKNYTGLSQPLISKALNGEWTDRTAAILDPILQSVRIARSALTNMAYSDPFSSEGDYDYEY